MAIWRSNVRHRWIARCCHPGNLKAKYFFNLEFLHFMRTPHMHIIDLLYEPKFKKKKNGKEGKLFNEHFLFPIYVSQKFNRLLKISRICGTNRLLSLSHYLSLSLSPPPLSLPLFSLLPFSLLLLSLSLSLSQFLYCLSTFALPHLSHSLSLLFSRFLPLFMNVNGSTRMEELKEGEEFFKPKKCSSSILTKYFKILPSKWRRIKNRKINTGIWVRPPNSVAFIERCKTFHRKEQSHIWPNL